jgi:phasin family protein
MEEQMAAYSRQAEEYADQASATAERTARAGTEAFRRNAESLTSALHESSVTATRIAERSADQFSKLFGLSGDSARQTMQQSADHIQALIDSSTVLAGAFQNLSGEWMKFVHTRIEGNLERVDDFLGCHSPYECMELQTRILRENVEALLQTARRTSELSTDLVEDAVNKISEAKVPAH